MNNAERAASTIPALEAFCAEKGEIFRYDSDISDDIADLICNVLHLAQARGNDPISIAAQGVGMFTAEDRTPDGEPDANDTATITVTPWGDQLPFTVFCQQADGGGTTWISTVIATDSDEAEDLGVEQCANDWKANTQTIRVLGIAKGDIEIVSWADPD
ncbi:hypothetical protein ABE527_14220 [Brucella sp. TWI432]